MAKGRKTGGRRPGSPNKRTAAAREVAMAFINGITLDEVRETWLLAKAESPSRAFGQWLGALEFVMPRLARSEVTGADGGPVKVIRVDTE